MPAYDRRFDDAAKLVAMLLASALGSGCMMENPAYDVVDDELGVETVDEGERGTGDGDPDDDDDDDRDGDGDGDGDLETGDGDGDPGDGDGDPGDGDGDPGDGDGDPGDGDGDLPCPPGLDDCDGQCVDWKVDKFNCGGCGVPCEDSQLCAQGSCAPKKYVFVSKATPALLDGLSGANELCQGEAGGAQIAGEFKAWLSTEFQSPSTTFSKQGVYVLRNGPVVAWSWADLTDGQLLAPINRDAFGEPIEANEVCGFDFAVWTGTNHDGTSFGPHCAGWLFDNNLDHGRAGNAAATDTSWSATDCTPECGAELGLYCVQQ